MNTEEFTQSEVGPEELHFDAHEFDGLREDFATVAETWLKKADRFVHDNPWLCIGMAAVAGCVLVSALRSREQTSVTTGVEPS